MSSTLEAAAVEERLFLRGADAAKHSVAMRKAAETADDVGMDFRPFQAVGIVMRAMDSDCVFLIGQGFGVRKWQIEKIAQVRDCAVESIEDGAAGHGAR